MATFDSNVNRQYYTQTVVNYGAYDVGNNTTPITWEFWLYLGSYSFAGNTSGHLNIDGTRVYTVPSTGSFLTANKWYKLASGSRTIGHGNDGTKSISISANFTSNAGPYPPNSLSTNASLKLPTIPRISSFTAPTTFNMGSTFNVTISPADSSFYHWVEVFDGGTRLWSSGKTKTLTNIVNISLSDLATRIPNTTSLNLTIKVWTYPIYDNSSIGQVSKTIKANLPTSVVPSMANMKSEEMNSQVSSAVDFYVRLLSNIYVNWPSDSGIYGSTIVSRELKGLGVTRPSSGAIINTGENYGNVTFTGKVTDSRGRTASKSLTVEVRYYAKPSIQGLKIERVNASGQPDPAGVRVRVQGNINVSELSEDGMVYEPNRVNLRIESKRATATSWTLKENSGFNSTGYPFDYTYTGYPIDYGYDFKITYGDIMISIIHVAIIPIGEVTQHWARKTTSFGKMISSTDYNIQAGGAGIHSEGAIRSDTYMYQRGGQRVASASEIPSVVTPDDYVISESKSGTRYYRRWANGAMEQWGSFTVPTSGTSWAFISATGLYRWWQNETSAYGLKFPYTFYSPPHLVIQGNFGEFVASGGRNVSKTGAGLDILSRADMGITIEFTWSAVGRWKY